MSENYFKVPNDIFDRGLNPYELSIVMYIYRCSNNGSTAFPSYVTIAKNTGMSRQKAISVIKGLEEKGIIKKKVRVSDYADNDSNVYEVVNNVDGVVNNIDHPSQPDVPEVVNNIDQGSQQRVPYKEIYKNNYNNKKLPNNNTYGKKPRTFNDYEQREYDYNKLEENLLYGSNEPEEETEFQGIDYLKKDKKINPS